MDYNKEEELKFLSYEVSGNWLNGYIGFKWGQELLGSYYAKKVRRKYLRYIDSVNKYIKYGL